MCGIVGAIPRLTQMVEGSCQVIPEGSAAAKFQFRVASPGICIFLKWSEREMRLRDRDCSVLARVHPDGLERLHAGLRISVRSAEERYERGDRPFSGGSSLEELGVSRGDMRSTGGRPRALRSLRPGPVFSRGERIRGEWPTRSLEKKRIREKPGHQGSGRAVLAPWLFGT